ncbi:MULTISPECIES: hypothetical protein [unclassified Mesorhizobium]|uniref:hypothetical protein n=1 Tax=unclassified Mesorhizobium TaxID=325217 RepID=UPI003337EFBF
MIEIINKVEPRFGSALMAYALYHSQPLQGFPVRRAMHSCAAIRPATSLTVSMRSNSGVHT